MGISVLFHVFSGSAVSGGVASAGGAGPGDGELRGDELFELIQLALTYLPIQIV
jgi:hypothetical protein